jgi:hypothetical protein
MSLQGSLQHIQLHDVIQLVSVSGKTGVFHLKKGTQEGKIFLKNGAIVHAELGEIKGEEAVYTLAVWAEGEFFFEPDAVPPEETIKKSNTNLLMEAARRLDEWKILFKKIPSTEYIPEFKPQPLSSKSHIHLNTGEWLILSKINGIKNIEDISKELNLSTFDVCKILYGLITNNLILLKEPSPPKEEKILEHAKEEVSLAAQKEIPKTATDQSEAMPKEINKSDEEPMTIEKEKQFHELDEESLKEKVPFSDERTAEINKAANKVNEPTPTLTEKEKALIMLNKIKEISEQILGNQGKLIVTQQYEKAKVEIERGKGAEIIRDVITHIARASTILKGPSTTELLLEQIKHLKIES